MSTAHSLVRRQLLILNQWEANKSVIYRYMEIQLTGPASPVMAGQKMHYGQSCSLFV